MPWYLYRLNPDYPDNATLVHKNNDNESKEFFEEEHKYNKNRLATDGYFFYSIRQEKDDDDMAKEKAIQHLKNIISKKKANQEMFSKKKALNRG